MPDESIFDILQPQEPDNSLRGAFTSGLKDLSGMFQQAIPALLSDPDVGTGEVFGAALLGGLGGPARQADAARADQEQNARTLLNILPGILPRMDAESQTQVLQGLFPGVQAAQPETKEDSATKELRTKMLNTGLDDSAPEEERRQALEIYGQLTPAFQGLAENFLVSNGVEPTPQLTGSYITSILSNYPAAQAQEHLRVWQEEGRMDFSMLTDPKRADDDPITVTEIAAQDIIAIDKETNKARDKGEEITYQEAGSRLGLSDLRISNAARAAGKSSAVPPGVTTTGELYFDSLKSVVDDDPSLDLEKLMGGNVSPKVRASVMARAATMFDMAKQGYLEQGIPLYESASPSARVEIGPRIEPEVDIASVAAIEASKRMDEEERRGLPPRDRMIVLQEVIEELQRTQE